MTTIAEVAAPRRDIKLRGGIKSLNIRGGAVTTIYPGSLIAHRIGSQLAEVPDPLNPRADLVFVGYAINYMLTTAAVDSGSGGWAVDADNNPLQVNVEPGIGLGFDCGSGGDSITMEHIDRIVYGYDNNTLYLTDSGGTLSPAGTVAFVTADGFVALNISDMPLLALLGGGGDKPAGFAVRAVLTTLGVNTGTTTGTLTVTATGALGAVADGLTPAIGDEVLIPAGTTNLAAASDAGPYEVANPGASGVSPVYRRPTWWPTGGAMPLGASIKVGGGGTLYPNTVWDSSAAKGSVIDTTDPALYPREVIQQVTLSASTVTISNVPIRSASKARVTATLAGGTPHATATGYNTKLVSGITAGALGTAAVIVEAQDTAGHKNAGADVSVLNVSIGNG